MFYLLVVWPQGEYCVHFCIAQMKKHAGQSRQAAQVTEGLKYMPHKKRLKELRLGKPDRNWGEKVWHDSIFPAFKSNKDKEKRKIQGHSGADPY